MAEESQSRDTFTIAINGKVGNEVNTFRVVKIEAHEGGKLRAEKLDGSGIVFGPERLMGCSGVINW